MAEKKRAAVIGYGGQGASHCERIINGDSMTLSGVYDIREERRELARNNGIFVYESNEAIFADENVDVIVIATPNDVHESLTVNALRNGHHVICEKPVTLSIESFDRMVAAQEEKGKILSVYQNRRWDEDYLTVKSLIDSKEMGGALRIESRVHGSRGIPGDWRQKKEFGGGMIYDWGVHLIDQMLQLIKEKICSVYCVTTHYTNDEVDDGFRLELTFEGGKTAYVEIGTYNFISMPRFYAQYEGGSLRIEDWVSEAKAVRLTCWNEKEVTPVRNGAGITKTMAPRDDVTLEEYIAKRPASDIQDFYRNFCDAADGKCVQAIKNDEVRRVLSVIEAAFLSAEERRVVSVEI